MWACQWLSSDDISNHKKRCKKLIINLRHRQALLLTRPAVLLGEGKPDTRERRKSSLLWPPFAEFFLTLQKIASYHLALKFPLQPRPIKMTVCQCKKGSGFLNGSWRHVRNHEILVVQVTVVSLVVMKFSSRKNKRTEVGEAMRSSSKQIKNMKLWDALELKSFVTNLSLRGQLHWAWPKREI